MTIQIFPSTNPTFSVVIEDNFNTRINRYGGAAVQRLSEWRFPVRTVTVPFGKLPLVDRNALYTFFRERLGAGEAFWYVHNRSQAIVDEYMGYGVGGALTLDTHSKTTDVATLVVYEDGVAQVKDTDYEVLVGSGLAVVDQIRWLVGHYPAAGALITHKCTGKLRIKVYMDDKFRDEWFRHLHSKTEITLYEEQW